MNVLITGASSGIGREFARIAAAEKHNLFIVARSKENLEKVKIELEEKHNISVEIVVSDLSKTDSARKLFEKLKDKKIDILINNAGFGYKGDFFKEDVSIMTSMVNVNILALMELTHYFGQQFVENNNGKILNIASIASFVPGPKQPVYYATKAFVRSFSRALAYNLRDSKASVTTLHPGMTRTDFFNAANAGNVSLSRGANPYDVAKFGWDAMMQGKDEVIFGARDRAMIKTLTRIMPDSMHAKMVDGAGEV